MMMIIIVKLMMTVLFSLTGGGNDSSLVYNRSEKSNKQQRFDHKAKIGEPDALRIAKSAARKRFRNLRTYAITACEAGSTWTVFFELKDRGSDGRGPGYVISKVDGEILATRVVAHAFKSRRKSRNTLIDRERALEISGRNLDQAGSPSEFNVSACELTRAWVIDYYKDVGVRGGGVTFMIDKRSGRIVSKTVSL